MAIVETSDKWTAAEAFIGTWLKDPTFYCNNCGQDFHYCCDTPRPVLKKQSIATDEKTEEQIILRCESCHKSIYQCCENPQIGNNKDHTYALIKQNKEMKKDRINEYGSNKTKTMRQGLSLPPKLHQDLNSYFQKMYQEKLFNTQKEMREFMKRFPAFKIAEKI